MLLRCIGHAAIFSDDYGLCWGLFAIYMVQKDSFGNAGTLECLQGFASCLVMPDLRGMGLCCKFISCCRSAEVVPQLKIASGRN